MMRINLLSTLLLAMAVAACNVPGTLPAESAATARASRDDDMRNVPDQSRLMYHALVAELSARRGYFDTAYDNYFTAFELSDDPKLLGRAARIAASTKAWDKAVAASEKWLAIDSDNMSARRILAGGYMRLKDEPAAIAQLAAIAEHHPEGVEHGVLVGYALLGRESNQALTHSIARVLAQRFPTSPAAQFTLARLSATMGDKASAIAALDKTLALQADHTEATLLRARVLIGTGESDRAFEQLRAALEKFPDDIPLKLGYAHLLVRGGQQDAALHAMDSAYALRPDDSAVVLSLGLIALEARRLTESKAYLNRVLALGQKVSEAHYYLGRIADSQRQYDTAIDHYSRIASGEWQLNSQTRIIELLALLGHIDQARARLQRLRELNPEGERQIHFTLVENKILRETGHHQEALDMLTDALRRYPGNVDILYALALAAEKVGRDDIFERHLRSVLRIEPDNARALNALGYYLVDRSRELDEAERYIKSALAIMPSDPAIIDSMGWLSYRRGDYPEALRLLRRAYQLLFDPEIAAHLGEVLWVSGDHRSASEIWDEALRKNPEDALLKGVIERFRE